MFISLLLSACSSMPHGQTSPTVKPDISHVSYSGAGDFSQKVKFYGVDTTLTVALNNIIPDDWKYTVSSDINLNENRCHGSRIKRGFIRWVALCSITVCMLGLIS
ncbi:hypothetical protein PCI56_04485 [Plesiomonas shigelloides subsp. oncorhynchi]|nr:hypothetical protein [Plesiomonas shigelloides]MDA1379271.1 hypothetical protein [Plesiomonas shigelloides]